jgi:hypothetical protein
MDNQRKKYKNGYIRLKSVRTNSCSNCILDGTGSDGCLQTDKEGQRMYPCTPREVWVAVIPRKPK